jgi:cobyrinic acid a,c-diamide synthase
VGAPRRSGRRRRCAVARALRAAAGATRQVRPGPLPRPPAQRIALAQDAAFSFTYPHLLAGWRAGGAEILRFSPLANEAPDPSADLCWLPGGYPELHLDRLAASRRSLDDLAAAATAGLPIYAECGGLLLLGDNLAGPDAEAGEEGTPMAGVLPFRARRGGLSLGYRRSLALGDGLVLRRGERRWGHEFHRWQLLDSSAHRNRQRCPLAASRSLWQLEGWGVPLQEEGWTAPNVHASWLHLHWAGCPEIPRRLVAAAVAAGPWNAGSSARTIGVAPPRSVGI